MQERVVVALLCAILAVSSSWSVPNDSDRCSRRCTGAAVLNNVATAACKHYCTLPHVDWSTLCRSKSCLENISCMVACQAFNGTANYSFDRNSLCTRQSVTRQRSLVVDYYWLPADRVSLANLKSATLTFGSSCQHRVNLRSATCDSVQVKELSLQLDKTGVRFQATNYGFDYEVFLESIHYQYLSDNKSIKAFSYDSIHYDYVYFLMPECLNPIDNGKQCGDTVYSVSQHTEIYPPVNGTEDPALLLHFTSCSGNDVQLSVQLGWSSYLSDARALDPDFPPLLSCWCWETCDVLHRVHIHLQIKGPANLNFSTVMEKNFTSTPPLLTTHHYKEKHTAMISTPWTDFNVAMAGLGSHGNKSVYDLNFTVEVHIKMMSYFAVNHYFGSLQAPQTARYWVKNDVKIIKQAECAESTEKMTASPRLSSGSSLSSSLVNVMNTSSPTRHTRVSPEAASDESTQNLLVPLLVGFLLLFASVAIAVVAYRRRHLCINWKIPRTLEGLQQLRRTVPGGSLLRTNYSYQSAPEFCDVSHWPTFPRSQLEFGRRLGHGQFGEVYMAVAVGITPGVVQTRVAVKMLQEGKSLKDGSDFLKEADYLQKFRHPHIVRLLGVCLEREPKMIILELMDGGDLLSYLESNRPEVGRPPWDDAEYVDIALDVASALKYLEKEKFVHRDVAARNCLVSFGPVGGSLPTKSSSSGRIVKLGDFGLARDIHKREYYRSVDPKAMLPICWMAPEALKERFFSEKSDVWAFGILLWEVFTYGETPYARLAANAYEAYNLITTGVTLDQPQYCPNPIFRVMKQCWAMQLEERPTFHALYGLLLTFQKSLARRKTLLTTLTSTLQSFASVGDVVDVDAGTCQPRTHACGAPKVVVHGTESALENVFMDSADDQSFAGLSGLSTPGLDDSAFENYPSDNSSHSSCITPLHPAYPNLLQHAPGSQRNPKNEVAASGRCNGFSLVRPGYASPENSTADSGHSSYDRMCHVDLDLLISESSV